VLGVATPGLAGFNPVGEWTPLGWLSPALTGLTPVGAWPVLGWVTDGLATVAGLAAAGAGWQRAVAGVAVGCLLIVRRSCHQRAAQRDGEYDSRTEHLLNCCSQFHGCLHRCCLLYLR